MAAGRSAAAWSPPSAHLTRRALAWPRKQRNLLTTITTRPGHSLTTDLPDMIKITLFMWKVKLSRKFNWYLSPLRHRSSHIIQVWGRKVTCKRVWWHFLLLLWLLLCSMLKLRLYNRDAGSKLLLAFVSWSSIRNAVGIWHRGLTFISYDWGCQGWCSNFNIISSEFAFDLFITHIDSLCQVWVAWASAWADCWPVQCESLKVWFTNVKCCEWRDRQM